MAIADSRSLVRVAFLSSAARTGILDELTDRPTAAELAARLRSNRTDRLEAWLAVGVELGELRRRGARYEVRGARAKALVAGDDMLVAHYRSILGYQVGPYAELRERLGDAPGEGRRDLAESADDIAQVSLAAAPFVSAWLTDALSSRPTRQILDIGCGTGVYTAAALAASPDATVTGIDLVEPVVDAARRHLDQAGFGRRFELVTGDARTWLAEREGVDEPFDAVLLLNDVYYVPPEERPALFRQVAGSLTPDGELLLVTLTRDGSLAAAHLHVMLVFQRGAASLPSTDELHRDLASAGLSVTDTERLVPTEPMLGIRAHREG